MIWLRGFFRRALRRWHPAGGYNFPVLSENRHQHSLCRICGGWTQLGHKLKCDVLLVPEGEDAVRVEIHREVVGYLYPEDAADYRKHQDKLGLKDRTMLAHAIITGGVDRGDDDLGPFIVRLALKWPPRLTAA